MALIPHSVFPRSLFGQEFGPRALDVFDPFDEMDMQLYDMVNWLERPMMTPGMVPLKYRVTVNCAGYDPASIKISFADDKLVVMGNKGDTPKSADEDHSHCSFKRTFDLPPLVEKDKWTSFMDKSGTLVIDMPYKEEGAPMQEVMPKVVDTADGHRAVAMDLSLPVHVDPSHVQVTAKDHDIIVKAQDKTETPNGFSSVSFFRRSTMPDNADIRHMRCTADGDRLHILAPLADHALPKSHQRIPIESY
jgi:HSP20 family molecular chaperone IbpA